MVLLPAVSAEVDGVEPRALGLTARCEALGVQRDVALVHSLERGQHLARAANELMQLESERRAALGRTQIVCGDQEAAQALSGGVDVATRVVGQTLGCGVEGDGFGAARRQVSREIDAQIELDPDRQGVILEGVEAGPGMR